MLLDHVPMLHGDTMEGGDDLLLQLQVDLQLDVLQLEDMVLDDDFEEVAILFGPDAPVHLLTDAPCGLE
jgi:hypothetical protein